MEGAVCSNYSNGYCSRGENCKYVEYRSDHSVGMLIPWHGLEPRNLHYIVFSSWWLDCFSWFSQIASPWLHSRYCPSSYWFVAIRIWIGVYSLFICLSIFTPCLQRLKPSLAFLLRVKSSFMYDSCPFLFGFDKSKTQIKEKWLLDT